MPDIGAIGSLKWKEFVFRGADDLGIALNRIQIDQLAAHCVLLIKWNKTTNLTRITDPVEVAVKHVLDSMVAAHLIPENASVLDVGSGAGFPGMVLKIVKPSLAVTLIDASRKKISFLNHVIRSVGLEGILALHRRTEQLAALPEFKKAFDVVVCRSFAALDVFVRDAVYFLSTGGMMIAYKKKEIEDEITQLERLPEMADFSLDISPYDLPCLSMERVLVILKRPLN
jgi:16S rRNA (guanine527-N7)-methyltransferase